MITNEWITGSGDLRDALAIRRAVFIDEQHVPEELEFDEDDKYAVHVVVLDDGEPAATGRIWFDGTSFRIGRCAVLKDKRGQGLGDLLVRLLLVRAFQNGASELLIHAQQTAVGFYERFGFHTLGEPFEEAGIAHVVMTVSKDTVVFPSECGCNERPL